MVSGPYRLDDSALKLLPDGPRCSRSGKCFSIRDSNMRSDPLDSIVVCDVYYVCVGWAATNWRYGGSMGVPTRDAFSGQTAHTCHASQFLASATLSRCSRVRGRYLHTIFPHHVQRQLLPIRSSGYRHKRGTSISMPPSLELLISMVYLLSPSLVW